MKGTGKRSEPSRFPVPKSIINEKVLDCTVRRTFHYGQNILAQRGVVYFALSSKPLNPKPFEFKSDSYNTIHRKARVITVLFILYIRR